MAYDRELADRIRAVLAGEPVREVHMFGGLSFMVNERMAVGANHHGGLLVRVDPGRVDDLIAGGTADVAQMGDGRQMSRGWLAVEAVEVTEDEDLQHWIDLALEHNRQATRRKGAPRRGREAQR